MNAASLTRVDIAARAPVRGAPRLGPHELEAIAAALEGWSATAARLEKTFRFPGYAETIGFVNAVAWIAQRLDHHPDLEVGYDRCRVVWTTHDAQGVTINDCIAAARTQELLK